MLKNVTTYANVITFFVIAMLLLGACVTKETEKPVDVVDGSALVRSYDESEMDDIVEEMYAVHVFSNRMVLQVPEADLRAFACNAAGESRHAETARQTIRDISTAPLALALDVSIDYRDDGAIEFRLTGTANAIDDAVEKLRNAYEVRLADYTAVYDDGTRETLPLSLAVREYSRAEADVKSAIGRLFVYIVDHR